MTEATGAEAPQSGRGRPRPDSTIERDGKVLAHLQAAGPQTRKQIVDATGMPGNEVYLSLYRLSRSDPPTIVRDGSAWKVPGVEAPAEAPVAA